MLNLFSFHLISSHRSFSWKLLMPSHCHRSLCYPISSQLISSHVLSAFFTSSYPISILLSLAQLFAAGHNCSLLFSCHLSFSHLFSSHLSLSQVFSNFHSSSLLISPQLISGFLKFSQLFSILLSSPQLMSAHLMPSHLLFLFSHLLRSSHTSSADLRCCQLVSSQLCAAHSQITSALLWPKTCPNKDLGAKASDPLYAASFCTEKLVHTEDCTHRSFYTGTGKLVHRDKEAFTHNKLLHRASFYTQQAFTHTSFCTQKLLHREAFTQRSL